MLGTLINCIVALITVFLIIFNKTAHNEKFTYRSCWLTLILSLIPYVNMITAFVTIVTLYK